MCLIHEWLSPQALCACRGDQSWTLNPCKLTILYRQNLLFHLLYAEELTSNTDIHKISAQNCLGTFQTLLTLCMKKHLIEPWSAPVLFKLGSLCVDSSATKTQSIACAGRDYCKTKHDISVKQVPDSFYTVQQSARGKTTQGTRQLMWKRKLLVAQTHSH